MQFPCQMSPSFTRQKYAELEQLDTVALTLFISQLPCQHQYEWFSCKWRTSIVKLENGLENDSSLGGLISENKVSLPDFTLALHPPGWIWIQLMLLAEITIVELLKRKQGSLPLVWSLVRSKSHWLHLFYFSPPVCFQMWKRWSLPLVWSGGSDVGPPSINWQCNTMHTVQQCTLHHNAARCAVKNTVQ